MYEPITPSKKQPPNLWLVGGLVILSVCLLALALSNGSSAASSAEAVAAAQTAAAKNAEALLASQSAAVARERILQAQVENLSAAIKQADARQSTIVGKIADYQADGKVTLKQMQEAAGRLNELNAELAKLRDGSELKELIASRKKSDSDLDAASAALRDANARLAASLARNAELEEENRRLREQSMRTADVSAGYRQSIAPRDDKWAKLNEDFLVKLDTDSSIVKSASGLRYKVIEEGHPARPNASSTVKCRYEGKLIDGKVFDTTKNRNDEPTEFPLSGVIPSWTEGVQKIGVGGKIILYCPHTLAYGDEGQGPIPGRSVLIFEVELVEITKFR
jgi:FKBP-type peptidyl-prolyl cis-trans isomerase FkpA